LYFYYDHATKIAQNHTHSDIEHIVNERLFWRLIAGTITVLLVAGVISNLLMPHTVPEKITLFLFGSLISITVGYSIVSPGSSPAMLSEKDEISFQRKQYILGIFFTLFLASLFVLPDVRESTLGWLLIPLVCLTPALILRQYIVYGRLLPQDTNRNTQR
jgi:hypothetical protein